jgi:hypothetical protein
MSRKDYRAFASVIKAMKEGQEAGFTPSLRDLALALSGVFAQENDRFDQQKFLEACGLGSAA